MGRGSVFIVSGMPVGVAGRVETVAFGGLAWSRERGMCRVIVIFGQVNQVLVRPCACHFGWVFPDLPGRECWRSVATWVVGVFVIAF